MSQTLNPGNSYDPRSSCEVLITGAGYFPSAEGVHFDFGHAFVFCRGIRNNRFAVEVSRDGGDTWEVYPFLPESSHANKLARRLGHHRCYVVESPLRIRLNVTSFTNEFLLTLRAKR